MKCKALTKTFMIILIWYLCLSIFQTGMYVRKNYSIWLIKHTTKNQLLRENRDQVNSRVASVQFEPCRKCQLENPASSKSAIQWISTNMSAIVVSCIESTKASWMSENRSCPVLHYVNHGWHACLANPRLVTTHIIYISLHWDVNPTRTAVWNHKTHW